MVKAIREVRWSSFLRDASAVAEQIGDGDVVLRRRGGTDLYLASVSRHESAGEGTALLARLLTRVLEDPSARERVVSDPALSWLRLMPPADRRRFVDALVETATAAAETGDADALSRLIATWKEAAVVRAGQVARGSGAREPDARPWRHGSVANRTLVNLAGSVDVPADRRGASWSRIRQETRRARAGARR